MNKIKRIILIICFFGSMQIVMAQQTVFNVPSADVTPKDVLFLQHESQFRPWNPQSYWWGTHYAAYGIGHNTDIDMTLLNLSSPNSHNMSLGIGFKHSIPVFPKNETCRTREIKVTVGSEVLIPLQNNGVGNWSYAHISGRLPKLNTRLTSGISVGTQQFTGTNCPVSFIAAIEQPVTKKLNIIGDWYSGNNNVYGFLIAGISYQLPKDSTIYLGYQIPNSAHNGKSGFVVELSTFLPCKNCGKGINKEKNTSENQKITANILEDSTIESIDK